MPRKQQRLQGCLEQNFWGHWQLQETEVTLGDCADLLCRQLGT